MATTFPASGLRAPSIAPGGHFIRGPLGLQLYGLSLGDPGATFKLVLIHGGLQALNCFQKVHEGLRGRDCYLVAFDLPWHGLSGPSPSAIAIPAPTPELWADCVHAVRAHYGLLDQPVTLLAWSLGGLIARNYLQLRGTEPVAGLVLVAAPLDCEAFYPFAQREHASTMEVLARLMNARLSASEQHAALLAFVDKLWWKLPSEEQYYQTLGYNARSLFSTGPRLEGILATQAPGDTQDLLQRLRCPVLFVQGQRDALIPPHYTRQVAQMLPAARASVLEMPDCGHSPFLELPDVFNAAVLGFLNGPVRAFLAGAAQK